MENGMKVDKGGMGDMTGNKKSRQTENAAKLKQSELGQLKQKSGESYEQFSERVKYIAKDAFPGTSEEFIQIISADIMIKGCENKEIKEILEDMDIKTIEDALFYMNVASKRMSSYQEEEPPVQNTSNPTTVVPVNREEMILENTIVNTHNKEHKQAESVKLCSYNSDNNNEDLEFTKNNLRASPNKDEGDDDGDEDDNGNHDDDDGDDEEEDDDDDKSGEWTEDIKRKTSLAAENIKEEITRVQQRSIQHRPATNAWSETKHKFNL